MLVKWINTGGDVVAAAACLSLFVSLLFLGWKYRVRRLSTVFVVFSATFLAFGLRSACAALLWWHEAGWIVLAAAVLRALAALLVAACAVIIGRCADSLFRLATEFALWQRNLARSVMDKRGAVGEMMRDAEGRRLIGELSELARRARELTATPGGEL